MVNSPSENNSPCTRLRLKNELSSTRRSLRYKSIDDLSPKYDFHIHSSKTKTPQSVSIKKN